MKTKERVMKKFFLILGVSLMCWSSFGTVYKVGNQRCPNFEEAEHKYYNKEDYYDHEEDYIRLALVYAMCLVIKGEQTNNENDVSRGMEILHYHADQQANVVANFMIGEYHFTGGTFKELDNKNLDIAVNYFSRTLAIIKTFNNYPTPFYAPWEKYHGMEMFSYYQIAQSYIDMFYFGVAGDYRLRVLNSPSYEGDRDLETFPKYNKNIEAYIDLAIEHSRNCRFLPDKPHLIGVKAHRAICAMMEEKSKILKAAYRKYYQLLSQDRCKDVGSDEAVFANCPEIDGINDEIISTYNSIGKEADRIFEEVP